MTTNPTTPPLPARHADPSDGPPIARPGVGTLGMWIFIASLSTLFAASLVGYLVVRSRALVWPPPDMPRLPAGLWVSTAVILLCSASIHWALSSIRRDRHGMLIGALLITLLLGLVFLVSQAVNWAWLISLNATISHAMEAAADASDAAARAGPLYLFTFYVLTALHGLHVIGGMGLLLAVTARAFSGRYSSAYHPGVKYAAMYWHFLDAVWLVMFVLLFLI